MAGLCLKLFWNSYYLLKVNLNDQEMVCSQADLALSDLTLAYRKLQVPFSCHSEICVMMIFLDFVNEHKATLQHLVAFYIHVLARQMVDLEVVEIGLISGSEVCELPGEISCSL